MSNCEAAVIAVLIKSIKELSTNWSNHIIHSNLSHADYLVAKTTYNVLNDMLILNERARDYLVHHSDEPLPDSFIPTSVTSSQETKDEGSESTVHTVDIESGTVSHGSN